METSIHTMAELFQQLGLDGDSTSIDAFVVKHRPLPESVLLADAPFWNASQAALLREEKAKDGDWAQLVDALSTMLRA